MVTRSFRLASVAVFAAAVALGYAACDKMPLVAPTGTVITLVANNTVLPVDGSIQVTAIAIAGGATTSTSTNTGGTGGTTTTGASPTTGQGVPVHNGTRISFTTTLGRLEPQEAETHDGQATVTLHGNGASGVATIRAFSGGAASNELTINVGAAAAKTVVVSASPQTLNSSGGTSTISARVLNANGSPLSGVPVTFTADNGTLSASTQITDNSGVATVLLTTSRETKVTATVSGDVKADVTVKVNPRIGITITPPTTAPTVGVAASFTVNVASTANVQNVRINWGDGTSPQDLGAVSGSTTVFHTFTDDGDVTVTATASDASGEVATVSTPVTVLPQQPPSVTVTASDNTPTVDQLIVLTATVSGATSTIQNYKWELGECSIPSSPVNITSNRLEVKWSATAPGCTGSATPTGTKVITVTVTDGSGAIGIGVTQVTVGTSTP